MSGISKWYVVHTYSGYENKVATNIEKIVENKETKDKETGEMVIVKKEVERKIFPGYVMVKVAVFEDEETGDLEMTDDTWYVIRNTRGVTGFVGPESKPVPLTEAEVYAMGVEKKVVKIDYEVGDMVTIIDGAFEGIIGTVRELDVDNNVVCVVISMLGRETPVDLELDQVEKVEED